MLLMQSPTSDSITDVSESPANRMNNQRTGGSITLLRPAVQWSLFADP